MCWEVAQLLEECRLLRISWTEERIKSKSYDGSDFAASIDVDKVHFSFAFVSIYGMFTWRMCVPSGEIECLTIEMELRECGEITLFVLEIELQSMAIIRKCASPVASVVEARSMR